MATYDIAVLPGDGIGSEVIAEAVKVLERVEALSGGESAFRERRGADGRSRGLAVYPRRGRRGPSRARASNGVTRKSMVPSRAGPVLVINFPERGSGRGRKATPWSRCRG
jgi:hypothetical protein